MAYLTKLTFATAEIVLRVKRPYGAAGQALSFHLVCASITGTGTLEIEEGNTDDETQALDTLQSDGSTAVTQAISSANFKINLYNADAALYHYLRFPAGLTGGTCLIYTNIPLDLTDVS